MTGKFISYYRVSTQKQGKSGLGLEAQKDSVADYLNGGRWQLLAEFTEIESGKRNDRPQLAEALALCRIHNATLVVAKLDRLARNVAFISSLLEANVDFVAVDLPQANRLTIHILAAVAEAEAEAISTRTKLALAAAKRRGVKLGGDRGNIAAEGVKGRKASAAVRTANAQRRANDLLPVIQAIQAEGKVSLQAIADSLNEKGILTPRGAQFMPTSVARLLAIGGRVKD
jgi:DNA invertase Pin-like site-specific DNA recombinase